MLKVSSLALAGAALATPAAAQSLTLACEGKVNIQGAGDPIHQNVTGSVVVTSNSVSISFIAGPCTITASRPNGVDFTCPVPKLGGGWYMEQSGFLDRYNGDLEINTRKTPPMNSDKFGTLEEYLLTCKPAKRMF
jgi:hypothetical protein